LRVRQAIEDQQVLAPAVEPILQVLAATRTQLAAYDKKVRQWAREDAVARQLMSAPGVGTVVALTYMSAVGDPARFKRSSSVAAYFGMTPSRYQSGEVDRPGRISRRGDCMVRSCLFEAAKVIVSRSAKPSALQSWGRDLAERIGNKKATMAVARKLAVILHRMWRDGTFFQGGLRAVSA
ncbi:MAG: IS110 family transposase, partial [Rhodomicrobium sp.]